MPERKSFTVFEVVNDRRREIFVSATNKPLFEVIAELRHTGAAPIIDWERGRINVRSIEFGLSEATAKAFIKQYLKTRLPPGWRFLS